MSDLDFETPERQALVLAAVERRLSDMQIDAGRDSTALPPSIVASPPAPSPHYREGN